MACGFPVVACGLLTVPCGSLFGLCGLSVRALRLSVRALWPEFPGLCPALAGGDPDDSSHRFDGDEQALVERKTYLAGAVEGCENILLHIYRQISVTGAEPRSCIHALLTENLVYFIIKSIAQAFDPLGSDGLKAQGFGGRKPAVAGYQPVQFKADGRAEQYYAAAAFQILLEIAAVSNRKAQIEAGAAL